MTWLRLPIVALVAVGGALVSLSGLGSLYFEHTGGFGSVSGNHVSTSQIVGYWLQLVAGIAVPAVVGYVVLPEHRHSLRITAAVAAGTLVLLGFIVGFS